MLFYFRVEIRLLSSVDCLCFVCRTDAVGFLYLVLEVVFCRSDVCLIGAVVLTCDGGFLIWRGGVVEGCYVG